MLVQCSLGWDNAGSATQSSSLCHSSPWGHLPAWPWAPSLALPSPAPSQGFWMLSEPRDRHRSRPQADSSISHPSFHLFVLLRAGGERQVPLSTRPALARLPAGEHPAFPRERALGQGSAVLEDGKGNSWTLGGCCGALGALHAGAFGEFALFFPWFCLHLLPRTRLALGIFCMETKGAALPLRPCSRFPNGRENSLFCLSWRFFPKSWLRPSCSSLPRVSAEVVPIPKVFPRLLQPHRSLLERCALPSRNPCRPHSIILLPPGNHCA